MLQYSRWCVYWYIQDSIHQLHHTRHDSQSYIRLKDTSEISKSKYYTYQTQFISLKQFIYFYNDDGPVEEENETIEETPEIDDEIKS